MAGFYQVIRTILLQLEKFLNAMNTFTIQKSIFIFWRKEYMILTRICSICAFLTYQNTVSGVWVTFSKRQTSFKLDPAFMYFSSGPKIKALASEIKKKWNLYTSIKQIIKKHAVYMSEKFETNGIKELNHQVFLKKYLPRYTHA